MSELIYADPEWPHGLSCPECGHVMEEGDQYTERLDAMIVDVEVVTVGFCPDCLPDPSQP